MKIKTVGTILLLAIVSTLVSPQSSAVGETSKCSVDTLPSFVQQYLLHRHTEWRIQESKDLGPRARERWEAEKPLGCPGIASGLFDGSKELSYAILLVPVEQNPVGYRLVIFSNEASKHSYVANIADQSESADSTSFFIHRLGIGGFFDPQSKKQFQVQAQEGILLVDAGEKEYEADIYFWAAGKYHSQPIDY